MLPAPAILILPLVVIGEFVIVSALPVSVKPTLVSVPTVGVVHVLTLPEPPPEVNTCPAEPYTVPPKPIPTLNIPVD